MFWNKKKVMFYFVGQTSVMFCRNNKKSDIFFLSVGQVRNNFRTAVTIPERSWARFRDVLSEFVDKSTLKDGE